jgi:hypothetical protein
MNWKEFLKPDWRKIVITVIILLFIPLPIWSNMDVSIYYSHHNLPIGSPLPSFENLPVGPIINVLIASDEFYNIGSFYSDILEYPLLLIGAVVISYLLFCLIVWIYEKYSKKREKK